MQHVGSLGTSFSPASKMGEHIALLVYLKSGNMPPKHSASL